MDNRQQKVVESSSPSFPDLSNRWQTLNVWGRAAALGSLWAAFEIVVGSFLHNLRVPFTGMIMATASVFLLTAAAQVWDVKGLLWRAALVCALMKSVSPSAVLLGPMIGIIAEGVLLQFSLNLLGRGWLGCVVGGALAVSYTLLHKIVALTITYGADLVSVFNGIVQFASKTTGWQGLQPASVLLALVSIQTVIGIAAGLAGWYCGRRTRDMYLENSLEVVPMGKNLFQYGRKSVEFNHSLPLLFVWLLTFPAGLWLVGMAPISVSASAVLAVAVAVVMRYRLAAGRLMNIRLWAEMLLVMLLSALVLGIAVGQFAEGLAAGVRMVLRAVLVVGLFGAIGVELTHPRILSRLSRGRLSVVQTAVQSGFRALPDFLGCIPDLKEVIRAPAKTLARLFYLVDRWQQRFDKPRLIILTGERGEGKTTLCLSLAEEAKRLGWTVGGIASPGEWKDGRREGYWVRDLSSGEERKLATRSSNVETRHVGSFTFSPEGFAFGRRALWTAIKADVQLLIVDEIGPLELRGEGWAQELMHMQKNDVPCVMVWVVRPNLIDIVKKRFAPSVHTLTIRASETRVDDLIGEHLQVK